MDPPTPFQDLNLLPDPSAVVMAATSSQNSAALHPSFNTTIGGSGQFLTPKVEPKLEPFDNFFDTQETHAVQEPNPFLASPPPNLFFNSGFAHTPLSVQTNDPLFQSPVISPDSDNVYSEFYRISELFRSAFSKRRQNYANVEVVDPNGRAIVPVSQENKVSTILPLKRKYEKRSSELVRVIDLGVRDQTYFRDAVRRTRMIFDSLRALTSIAEEKSPGLMRRLRGDLKASSLMRERNLWVNRDKRIVGPIPGVLIGDIFFFRMELCVVGLHGQPQAGIDYVPASQSSNGEPIATSVIVSGGYEDDEDAGDVIIYTGHGGQDKFSRQCMHQKLEGGNLGLERSMHYGIEVRVIRGMKYAGSVTSKIYVYDGLYRILDCWFDVGKSGFGVYKFKLVRIDGQPEMGSSILKFAQTLRSQPLSVRPSGYLSLDISLKKEAVPVRLFNDIDNDQEPLYYEYLVKTVFPPFAFHQSGNGTGCNCVSGCLDDCFCAMKNGGEFAYDQNGFLVRGKPMVFECGPFCKCPPQCRNRVSQKGLKHRLEIFRSRETGWGVRSLDLIHAGSFICEYAGVILTREQAQVVSMNGDSLIYPNRFTDRWVEWGDLSQIDPNYVRPSYPCVPPLDFAMDVSRMRNVACYLSHSTSPNVLVQFVLYDHNNLMFPHVMLFAMENIPPLRELSLDYGVADEWSGKLAICN